LGKTTAANRTWITALRSVVLVVYGLSVASSPRLICAGSPP